MSVVMPAADPQSRFDPDADAGPAAEPWSVNRTGRLRQEALSQADRNFGIAIHLSPLISFSLLGPFALLVPLVLWLVRKDESSFLDDHGREVTNFCISFVVLHIVLALTVVLAIAIPVLWIVGIVSVIRGAIASSNGEFFRYPMTIRFIS